MRQTCLFLMLALSTVAVAQPIGNTHVAGTTEYDLQHAGSCGRMIAVDDSGFVHVVWTFSMLMGEIRYVKYNRWEPDSQRFTHGGYGLDISQAQRAGYPTIVRDHLGHIFPALHRTMPWPALMAPAVVSVACSYHLTPVPWSDQTSTLLWPQIAVDHSARVHLLLESCPLVSGPTFLFYTRGVPETDSTGLPCGIQWQAGEYDSVLTLLDTVVVVAHTDAASRISQRVALGWLHPRDTTYYNNDVLLQISEDAGQTWNPRLNVTNFVSADTACLSQTHDTLRCNRDTLRAYTDLSLVFDREDHLHAAFTTSSYFSWRDSSGGPSVVDGASLIWHWNEATGQFSLVANGWTSSSVHCGTWQTLVERPCLAIDQVTGFLYCAYLRYDTAQTSEGGYYNADVWISVSTDNGISWSTGTNVTRTRPSVIPAPAGDCLSERDPTVAETVSNGYLHLSYLLDADAGNAQYGEGTGTLNNFIYQRIPVDSIATTPLMPRYPLHWDSTGFLAAANRNSILHPSSFILSVYPNPFNNTAVIAFELPVRAPTTLKVFDLLGREVTTLQEGMVEAGEHTVRWDASRCASGIYFVSLRAGSLVRTQKIMLLK